MQNELQWWEEQMMAAINVGDREYAEQCKATATKLLDDIRNERRK